MKAHKGIFLQFNTFRKVLNGRYKLGVVNRMLGNRTQSNTTERLDIEHHAIEHYRTLQHSNIKPISFGFKQSVK